MHPVGTVEDRSYLREIQAVIGQHSGVLRAFAREDEGDLSAAPERLGGEIDARGVLDLADTRLGELAGGEIQFADQVLQRRRDDRQP